MKIITLIFIAAVIATIFVALDRFVRKNYAKGDEHVCYQDPVEAMFQNLRNDPSNDPGYAGVPGNICTPPDERQWYGHSSKDDNS